jgi:hypothetical protein
MGASSWGSGSESITPTHRLTSWNAANIVAVQIDVLIKRDSFQGGEVSERAQEITGPAREEHRRRGFGFWEYVLSSAYDSDPTTRRGLLVGALRRSSAENVQVQFGADDFCAALASRSFSELPERTIVSLTSHVETSAAESVHLPMLDMGAPVSDVGANACVDAIASLGLAGQLYETGRSYHFIANQPVSPDMFRVVLARAQLLSPINDCRWIAHQLIDGRAGLRISTDVMRHTTPHKFIAAID